MTTCKIEGLPEGWEVVGFRKAETAEYYLGGEETPSQWYYDSSSNGTYVIVRRKEKTLAERFDEWLKTNDIKLGSRVKVTRVATAAEFPDRRTFAENDAEREHVAGKVCTIVGILHHCQCVRVRHDDSIMAPQMFFEVCAPVKKVLKPWDMDTMPERVKVKHKVHGNLVYWARPTGIEHAVVGATNVMTYRDLLANYTQGDGSPCGIEVEE